MKRISLLFIMVFLMLSCASANKTHTITEKDTAALEALVNGKSFEIDSQWAQPLATGSLSQISNAGLLPYGSNVGSINLAGNANYLQVRDSIVKAFLPFYGERRMGGSYGNIRTGIQFNSQPKKYEVEKEEKGNYKISFEVSDENNPTENYLVQVQIFPNLSSTININSSHRSYIQYRGKVSKIKIENE